ncbi:MAG TPA: site-specific integrase [Patescibacteria group bacterium]|nr:site-specific integrase [Patescibacteria group bacterium]
MDLYSLYKEFLFSQEPHLSEATVKNYLSDLQKFFTWFQQRNNKLFSPFLLTNQLIAEYKQYLLPDSYQSVQSTASNLSSVKSYERHLSSLRKFVNFLLEKKYIREIPRELIMEQISKPNANFYLDGFKNFLYKENDSDVTITNYLLDIQQFVDWLNSVRPPNDTQNAIRYISSSVLEEYKLRLTSEQIAPATINRKLSSLRKYVYFLSRFYPNQINPIIVSNVPHSSGAETTNFANNLIASNVTAAVQQVNNAPSYSRFPPLRLTQKIGQGMDYLFNSVVIEPLTNCVLTFQYLGWLISGKRLFEPSEQINPYFNVYIQAKKRNSAKRIKTLSPAFFAPIDLNTNKQSHNIIYKCFKRYQKLLKNPLLAYANFCLITLIIVGISTYVYVVLNPQNPFHQVLGASNAARLVSFSGKLLDKYQQPITQPTLVRFGIYNDSTASGSALLWQDVESVKPASDGTFNITLGYDQSLPSSLFSDNPALFLGTTVGNGSELQPRQELPTSELSNNSQSLQGMNVITQTADPRNTILALDSTGNLQIAAPTTFSSTNNIFTLSGQSVLLTSNPQSNGNVVLSPDGLGRIDLQKPLVNTSRNGTVPGLENAVQVADQLLISATTSASPILQIVQNNTGDLISASSSGSNKFLVNYLGAGTFADDLAVNGGSLTSTSTTFDLLNNGVMELNIGGGAENITLGTLNKGVTTINNLTTSLMGDLTIAGTDGAKLTHDDAGIEFSGNGNHLLKASSGSLQLGQATLTDMLNLNHGVSIVPLNNDDSNNLGSSENPFGNLFVNNVNAGSLALTQSSPNSSAHFIDFLDNNGNSLGSITNNGSGGLTFNGLSQGDFAEYLPKNDNEDIPTGALVCLTNEGNVTQCDDQNSKLAGVVSSHPTILAGKNLGNASVAVGLEGQIDIEVTTSQGQIQPGDPIAVSDVPGVGVKATSAGPIIGHALAAYTSSNPYLIGQILVLVQPSWFDPGVNITSSGNLSIKLADNSSNQQPTFSLTDSLGNTLIANLQTGLLKAQQVIVSGSLTTGQVVTNSLVINGQDLKDYIISVVEQVNGENANSQLASIPQLSTNVISPLASNSAVLVAGNLQTSGNASIGGTLSSQNLQTGDATISGTLYAKKILADEIEGLPTASPSASYTIINNNIQSSTISAEMLADSQSLAQLQQFPSILSNYINTASFSAQIGNFSQGLTSFGPTTLSDTAIAGQLSVDQLTLADTGIDVLGGDLQLQPLRQGGISFLSGLVSINTSGDLTVNGNALFAQNVTVNGALTTNVISPLSNNPNSSNNLTVKLSTGSGMLINNASGSSVLSFNQQGDVQSSGSGNFNQIMANDLSIVRSAQADTSNTQTIASSSAGTAVIYQGQTERTIITPFVKASSLIYISPTSDTQGITPYIARQNDNQQNPSQPSSFTIQVAQPATSDIHLNWWVVN